MEYKFFPRSVPLQIIPRLKLGDPKLPKGLDPFAFSTSASLFLNLGFIKTIPNLSETLALIRNTNSASSILTWIIYFY